MGATITGVLNQAYIFEYFYLFACKNCNAMAIMPATNILAVENFLFNIFLAVFTFLIANTIAIAINMLD